MRKNTILLLIIATSFIIIGTGIFVMAMTEFEWDFTKLSTVKYENNVYDSLGEFESISIETGTANIAILPSEDGKVTVLCHAQEKAKHQITIKDNALVITETDTRKWYEHIGISFDYPKISVYLPASDYGALSIYGHTSNVEIADSFMFESIDITENTGSVTNFASATNYIKIKTDTGKIHLEDITADTVYLSVSTGKTNLTNVKCRNLISTGDTGNLIMQNVLATEKFNIERDTGNIKLDSCDAAEIYIETDTGSVTGTLLSEKEFIAKSDTGRISVPKTLAGGKCEIITDTGNIRISLK